MWSFLVCYNWFKRHLDRYILRSFRQLVSFSLVFAFTKTTSVAESSSSLRHNEDRDVQNSGDDIPIPIPHGMTTNDMTTVTNELKEWISLRVGNVENIGSTLGMPFYFEHQSHRFRIEYLEFY